MIDGLPGFRAESLLEELAELFLAFP